MYNILLFVSNYCCSFSRVLSPNSTIVTMLSQACRQLARDALLSVRSQHNRCVLEAGVRQTVSQLRLGRRGRRAGEHVRRRALAAQTVTSAVRAISHATEIPVINGNRNINKYQLTDVTADCKRRRHLAAVSRAAPTLHLGLFNAQSVREKSASISTWITDNTLNIVALTETWHDSVDSPQLIACAPDGYHYVERARPRSESEQLNEITNHGDVCLLFSNHLRARPSCRR